MIQSHCKWDNLKHQMKTIMGTSRLFYHYFTKYQVRLLNKLCCNFIQAVCLFRKAAANALNAGQAGN